MVQPSGDGRIVITIIFIMPKLKIIISFILFCFINNCYVLGAAINLGSSWRQNNVPLLGNSLPSLSKGALVTLLVRTRLITLLRGLLSSIYAKAIFIITSELPIKI